MKLVNIEGRYLKYVGFIPVIFHNGIGFDFNQLFIELFKRNNGNRKKDNIPLAA